MKITDAWPSKSYFKKGERIEVFVSLDVPEAANDLYLTCSVYRLHEKVEFFKKEALSNLGKFIFDIDETGSDMSGFGVLIELHDENRCHDYFWTAFDILKTWKCAPRYGFLSDFSADDLNDSSDLESMNRYHINVVQYYDWMYRHHSMMPPEKDFVDPLGRSLNIDVVKQKIDMAHNLGMKAVGYGAVYGADSEFYNNHKDWALYSNDGSPEMLMDFLYIMDISQKSKWHDHIMKQYLSALRFGFDGIHMDQYGFPKSAVRYGNEEKDVIYLREEFYKLINDTKKYLMEKGYNAILIFNAVNNWPVETVSKSEEDAVYVEVWPPNDTYQDLYNIICNAKKYEIGRAHV